MAGLATKGSMSSKNKSANKAPYYKPNNPVDRNVRKQLSKPSKQGKVDGTPITVAAPKTVKKAEATALKRAAKGKK